jgi:hypothetical protein
MLRLATPTFWQYFRLWFHAVRKGMWDTFGTLTTLAALAVWVWSEFWPQSFQSTAARFGVTPENAMSDWVWQVPLGVGLLTLAFRAVRAPYEIHLATVTAHDASLNELRSALAQAGSQLAQMKAAAERFEIDVETGGYYFSASKPGERCVLPGVWLFAYGVTITNRADKQIPLELWLHIAMRDDGSWRVGEVCQSVVPAWGTREFLDDQKPFDRILNLPAISAESGYCAARFEHSIIGSSDVSDLKGLAETRAVWLEIKNKLTNESKFHSVNYLARNIDRTGTSRPNSPPSKLTVTVHPQSIARQKVYANVDEPAIILALDVHVLNQHESRRASLNFVLSEELGDPPTLIRMRPITEQEFGLFGLNRHGLPTAKILYQPVAIGFQEELRGALLFVSAPHFGEPAHEIPQRYLEITDSITGRAWTIENSPIGRP